ncbi:hypothetical protein SPRG_10226 [Saprolegnia parasitica CBS 223.65]|uniref:Uncharacterized protein n=1 Tax=Saprolegnia parasitica (strain CBS 223.65) TaxID=695850 RepID=A0A067CD40_SAPPC|nr:hypothetical protein SPRG_10226 [Saprolegnia parasitica CBS 223.65]KDO24692.1 hypothetical protein SPRG_10226 [Saprolegnia parasitica CBS 223.65]|eukprot:XP_012204572.1 hypothetical protein SPRG_10226 [Saprolegnia parasitica CBS 223.65]
MNRFVDTFRSMFKDIERTTLQRPVRTSDEPALQMAAVRRAKRRSHYSDVLSTTFPNTPTRASDDAEHAKHSQILEFLLQSFDATCDESHAHVLQALELCGRLSAVVGAGRVAKTQLEMAFMANVVALAYLGDEGLQAIVIAQLEAATAAHDWFRVPSSSSSPMAKYPKWVPMAHAPTAPSFESSVLAFSMLAKLSPNDMKKGPPMSRDVDALLGKLVLDGEFYTLFLASVLNQSRSSVTETNDWKRVVPHHDRLVYVGLRLLHECAYETWAMAGPSPRTYFAFTMRGVKTAMLKGLMLLLNPKLTYLTLLALLEATNVNNERSVGHCLHQLEEWFMRLTEYKFDLMATVRDYDKDFSWIFAIKLLLLSDHMDILKKTLLFLYNVLPMLPDTLRTLIMRVLLHRHFELFLHWQRDVRRFYQHVLVYRLCPGAHRVFLFSMTDSLLAKVDGEHELSFFNYDALAPGMESLLDDERAKWTFFDVLILSLCLRERERAHEANKEQRRAADLAAARVATLQKDLHNCSQSRVSASFARECMSANATTDVEEKLAAEVDRLRLLQASLPYLRVTPQDHEFELAVASSNVDRFFTPREGIEWKHLQQYARVALLEYTNVLQSYYAQCSRHHATGRFDVARLPLAPELTF